MSVETDRETGPLGRSRRAPGSLQASTVVTERPPLFGRDAQMARLEQWRTEASAGEPRIVFVDSAPGAGATRLVDEFARRSAAAACDVRTASAAVPVRIGTVAQKLSGDHSTVTTADQTAEYVSVSLLMSTGTVGDDPYAPLVESLLAAALTRCVVLVLDDAQCADSATRTFLTRVVTSSRPHSRLMVVLVRGASGERHLDLIDDSARRSNVRHLALPPLDTAAVGDLIHHFTGGRAAPSTVAALVERSGAQPRRLLHALRQAREDGELRVGAGRVEWDRSSSWSSPTAVLSSHDDRRIERLVPEVADRLAELACLGVETAGDAAASALDCSPVEIMELATRSEAIVEQRHGRLIFDGPGLRQRLYLRNGVGERRRLHLVLACRLARCLPQPGDGATGSSWARLADEQFVLAGVAGGGMLRQAAAAQAADEAVSWAAWEEAVAAYGRALEADDGTDPLRAARLRLRRGQAAFHAGDARLATTMLQSSCHEFGRLGESADEGWALVALLRVPMLDPRSLGAEPDTEAVNTYTDRYESTHPAICARLYSMLAERAFDRSDHAGGAELVARARGCAAAGVDAGTRSLVEFADGLTRFGALDLRGARRCFTASAEIGAAAGDRWASQWGATRLLMIDLIEGDIEGASQRAAALADDTAAVGNWADQSLALATGAGAANVGGDLRRSDSLARAAIGAARRCNYAFGPMMSYPELLYSLAVAGNEAGCRAALTEWAAQSGDDVRAIDLSLRPLLGDEPAVLPLGLVASVLDVMGLAFAGAVIDSCPVAAVDEWQRVEVTLAELDRRGLVLTPVTHCLINRLRAVVALRLADRRRAEVLVDRALDQARAIGARVEWGRCLLLADELGRPSAARSAEQIFTRIGAFGLARSATVDLTQAGDTANGADGDDPEMRVIVYTDIVDSTALNAIVGDATFVVCLRRHNAILRARLDDCRGVEFTHTGDGIGATFSTGDDAVRFARLVQSDFASAAIDPDFPVRVRIGMSAGVPQRNDDDFFGLAVVRAVRVCALAGAGETLASSEVVRGVTDASTVVHHSTAALKGLPGMADVYRIDTLGVADTSA